MDKTRYVRTYIRVNAGYVWGSGMERDKTEAFYEEVKSILEPLGFTWVPNKYDSACPRAVRGIESLYCHPMDLSGYLAVDQVQKVSEAIKAANPTTFQVRAVDTYTEGYAYSEFDLKVTLQSRQEDVENLLLEACKTKRRNLYKRRYDVVDRIGTHAQQVVEAIDQEYGNALANTRAICTAFVQSVYESLVTKGKLIKSEDNLVRTATERDLVTQ